MSEIDGKLFPIEIKSGWATRTKSLNEFDRKYAPDFRVVMSARNLKINRERKLHYYPLYLASRFPLPG